MQSYTRASFGNMVDFIEHVIPGLFTFLFGLWHLFNHIKVHVLHPESYTALPWFPTSNSKYLEPFLLAGLCLFGILRHPYVVLQEHQFLYPIDGTITSHVILKRFEHSSWLLANFIYGTFAIVLDRARVKARYELTLFLGALAFAVEFFVIHFHDTDHTGPVGQYHLLIQPLLLLCSATFLIGIGLPKSFIVSFVRSLSICFIGIWFTFMGIMLWTPGLQPKGCFMQEDHILGQTVVRCSGEEELHRAKSLINLQFSCFTIGLAIFGVSLYLVLDKIYDQNVKYFSLGIKQNDQMHVAEDYFDDADSLNCKA